MSRVQSGLVGALVGSALTLGVQALRQPPPMEAPPATERSPAPALWPGLMLPDATPPEPERTRLLFEAGPALLEHTLKGSKCFDVSVGTPSRHRVSYEYDALYDVTLTYKHEGAVKRVVLPFGFTKGVIVVPTASEVVVADDSAELLHTLTRKEGSRRSK